jgi:hypothetical protein
MDFFKQVFNGVFELRALALALAEKRTKTQHTTRKGSKIKYPPSQDRI